jgi:hypothetical protein
MGLLKTLMKLGGILAILFGIFFIGFGAYGTTPEKPVYRIDISFFGIESKTELSAQGGFQIFTTVGIMVLLVGIAMTYFGGLWSILVHVLGKTRLGLLVFSTAFLALFFIYQHIFYSFKSTSLGWFVVIMFIITFVTTAAIVLDQIFAKLPER